MSNFRKNISEGRIFIIFMIILLAVLMIIKVFPYEKVFLSHLDDLAYFREAPPYSERAFEHGEQISWSDQARGRLLSSFEESAGLEGQFQMDESISLEGGKSIRLLAHDEDHGFATVNFTEMISSLKAISFYLYVQDSDSLADFKVSLRDDHGRIFESRVKVRTVADKWVYAWLSAQEFSSLSSGLPEDIVSLRFDLEAVPGSSVQVNIDSLSFEDDRSFVTSWNLLNPSALSLENREGLNHLVFQSVPRDHVTLYKDVPEFRDGSITAEISSSFLGAPCGLVLQGERTPAEYGIILVTMGPGTPSWRLWNFQPGNRELLGNGYFDDWVFSSDEPVWMRLAVDGEAIAVYLGKSRDSLELLGVFANPNPDPGLPGIVSFDDARCRFRDISIEYDPL